MCDNRPVGESRVTPARKTGTQAIERALSILRQFSASDEPLSLTEVARAGGLTAATTHRILATLVRERLLSYDPATERYRIGPDSLFLFAAAARRFGIAASRSQLEQLVASIGETAALGVLDGSDTIVVLQVESDLPLRFSRPIGTRVPSHVSAMGKALLAGSGRDPREVVETLGRLHRFTEHTITDKRKLIAELQLARERGWALNDNERYDGVRALAVPIPNGQAPARASLGVQGPAGRLPDQRIESIVEGLRTTAHALSLHLQITAF